MRREQLLEQERLALEVGGLLGVEGTTTLGRT